MNVPAHVMARYAALLKKSGAGRLASGDRYNLRKSYPSTVTVRSPRCFTTHVRKDVDADHVGNFLDAVKSRRDPIEPVEVGYRTASLCILGNIAQILKRKFTWSPVAERSTDEDVNRMLQRPMREPWKL